MSGVGSDQRGEVHEKISEFLIAGVFVPQLKNANPRVEQRLSDRKVAEVGSGTPVDHPV